MVSSLSRVTQIKSDSLLSINEHLRSYLLRTLQCWPLSSLKNSPRTKKSLVRLSIRYWRWVLSSQVLTKWNKESRQKNGQFTIRYDYICDIKRSKNQKEQLGKYIPFFTTSLLKTTHFHFSLKRVRMGFQRYWKWHLKWWRSKKTSSRRESIGRTETWFSFSDWS